MPFFAISVDLVVLTVRANTLSVLLITRQSAPFATTLALPGGIVEPEDDLAEAAAGTLAVETGLSPGDGHFEQLATYGAVRRDPRGRVVTVAYLVLLPDLPAPRAGGGAASAAWWPVAPLLSGRETLAFDHGEILTDGVERARSKLEYSSLAARFCPPHFTINQLRKVYEAVWGVLVDPRNFHRKVTGTPGFVVPTDQYTDGDRGRPARVYRKGPADSLHPPLLRR